MAKVSVGPSSVAGGAVTLAAYATAVVAFAEGARDEATISAVVVGTVALVTTLGGRFAQAVAALLRNAPERDVAAQQRAAATLGNAVPSVWTEGPENATTSQVKWHGTAGSSPRPMTEFSWDSKRQTNVVMAPEPPAPFDPDGEPQGDGDLMASLPEESFVADDTDTDGADDHPQEA